MSSVSYDGMSPTGKLFPCSTSSPTSTSSSSNAQLRKIKKPLIERRRRERINECLGQLKTLVLEATNKDESRYSKMEKADILEMTVAHLKLVHNSRRSHGGAQVVADGIDSTVVDQPHPGVESTTALRYLMGFSECAREVATYLSGDVAGRDTAAVGISDDVRSALMRHLESSLRLRANTPSVSVAHFPSSEPETILARPEPESTVDRRHSLPLLGRPNVDAAGAVPSRRRCDSGVYSDASSPVQADDLTVAGVVPARTPSPSPLELTTTKRNNSSTPEFFLPSSMPSAVTQLPVVGSSSSDVWRPW